jgi:hypothetical protein
MVRAPLIFTYYIAAPVEKVWEKLSDSSPSKMILRPLRLPVPRSAPSWHCSGSPARPHDVVEGFPGGTHKRVGRSRFLHGRSSEVAGLGDLLRAVLPSPGDAPDHHRWNHPASGRGVDGADRPDCHPGELGLSESMPLRAARPGQEVLCLVPVDVGGGWCETDHASVQESEFERVCRALGSIGETGVPVKLVLLGEGPLQRSLTEFTAHYHLERNHQGNDNQVLTPLPVSKGRKIHCHQRLGARGMSSRRIRWARSGICALQASSCRMQRRSSRRAM